MSEQPFQRTLARRITRYQARLEAGAGDRWIPVAIFVGLSTWLVWLGLARFNTLQTGTDLAAYSQAVWLLSEGFRPAATLFGNDVHLLEVRWSFILYPVSLLVRFSPAPQTLMTLEGIALSSTVFPLWGLARKVARLRIGGATALILAFALHPVTHLLAVDDFHPESFAVPALVGMAYFGAGKRWYWYWAMVAIVLLTRADLGLAVAVFGFLVLSDTGRNVGLWTVGVGTVWALGLLLVVQPLLSGGAVIGGRYGEYGDSLGDVFVAIARSPIQFLGDLTASDNVTLLVTLLAPVLFLPLLALRHLIPAMPLGAIYLVAERGSGGDFAEKRAMLLAFVFVAATYALRRLGNLGVDRVFIDGRLLAALVAAAGLFFVTQSPASPYEDPLSWNERTEAEVALSQAASRLESDIPVRASPSALGALSERKFLYELDDSRDPSVATAVFRARAVLLDERDFPEFGPQREAFVEGMELQGFKLVADHRDAGVLFFYRP